MENQTEELLAIVEELAMAYVSFESTSIRYEKAEQLMEAVQYCICETESQTENQLVLAENQSVRQVYKVGRACVEKKVKQALDLYHQILPEFIYYKNRCLYHDFIQAIPYFFKWYDIKFEPQNTIITLDYPVLKDLSNYRGIDRVYEFLRCIELEQKFFCRLLEEEVMAILLKNNPQYEESVENICEIILCSIVGHILVGKSVLEQEFEEEDYRQIKEFCSRFSPQEIRIKLREITKFFLQQYYKEESEALFLYLEHVVDGIAVRLYHAAQKDVLFRIL